MVVPTCEPAGQASAASCARVQSVEGGQVRAELERQRDGVAEDPGLARLWVTFTLSGGCCRSPVVPFDPTVIEKVGLNGSLSQLVGV